MEKNSRCFPSFKCLHKKSSSTAAKSSIRMPTIREFLGKNKTTSIQTGTSNRIQSQSTILRNSLSHKSSLIINREQPICVKKAEESFNTINLSNVIKNQVSSRDTFFISRLGFDEIFKNSLNKRQDRRCKSKLVEPFVLENSKLKLVPITPGKRKTLKGCRISVPVKSKPVLLGSCVSSGKFFSGDWKQDLEDINFK